MFHSAFQRFPMLGICFFACFLACCVRADTGKICPEFTDLNLPDALIGTNLKVQLLLYTRKNKNCSENLSGQNLTTSVHLNVTKKIIFVIHGYRPTGSPPIWINEIKNTLLSKEDVNIIIVDWNRGATTLIYPNAVSNTWKVAEILKNRIDEMLENGASLDSVYMIGVSLGAHIAGFVGKAYSGKIGRITGLDPAGPSFSGKEPTERLHHTDAQFVDVIHTDIDDYRSGECANCEDFKPLPCPALGYYADKWKNHLIEKNPPVTNAYFDTSDKKPFCMYHYFVEIITWNKSSRRGFIRIQIEDSTGNTIESKINSDAAVFHQYRQAKILAGFYLDFDSVSKITLSFSTKNIVGPKYKLRVLQMRLRSLSNTERFQLCRYDFILLENNETSFKPIPCHEMDV